MAAYKKSIKQTTTSNTIPTEFHFKSPLSDMSQTKPRVMSSHRPIISNIPKSSLSYPTAIPSPRTPYRLSYYHQQQQQGERFLYALRTPVTPRRAVSARISNNSLNTLPLHQQPHLLASPLLPRPHPQYGHFLAYLRRQSLARIRRKQQEAGNTDTIESTIKFNTTRPISQTFHSISHASLNISTAELLSMPTMSLTSKRRSRPLSSHQQIRRPSSSSIQTNYRLSLNQSPSLKVLAPPPSSPTQQTPTKITSNEQLIIPTSTVLTPTNSIVDDTIKLSTLKTPYELQLSGDMLNYCYVSDSGVKYQGQLLATFV
ncbi:unnamed protein product [Rotaria sordida]|uniref:Uncharacterized protein n=1 Tax=Rotaria sordida TaxID=392033 RepID=A0A818NH30_9BILA|nr:unnamed protein product [Rotaria sordida]